MRGRQAAVLLLTLLAIPGCGGATLTPDATGPTLPRTTAVQETPAAPDWRLSQWHIGDLEVRPPAVKVGQAVELAANIYVPGIVERYGRAYFLVDGRLAAEVDDLLIYGDEILPVVCTFTPTRPGTYEVRFNVVLRDDGPATTRQGDLTAYLTVTP